MLPKDSAIVNEIKKYLIYYATQLEDEGQRLKDSIDKNNKVNVGQNKLPEIIPNIYQK